MSGFDHQEDLEAAAAEELERACTLGWAQLRRHTPWGDSYEGFSPAGVEVVFERSYLWNDKPGGDILVEVAVRHPDGSHSATLNRLLHA
jgi:hypothetical protein